MNTGEYNDAQWAEPCCKRRWMRACAYFSHTHNMALKYGSDFIPWQQFTHRGTFSEGEMKTRVYRKKSIALLAVLCFRLVLALLSLQPWRLWTDYTKLYPERENHLTIQNYWGRDRQGDANLNFPGALSERHFYWGIKKGQILRLFFRSNKL
jgi:hypothetical protein